MRRVADASARCVFIAEEKTSDIAGEEKEGGDGEEKEREYH